MNEESRPTGEARTGTSSTWLVAALIPALADLSLVGSLAWGGALLVGALLAAGRPLRWVAVAWGVAVIAPGTSLPAIASSGSLIQPWSQHLLAAVLGIVLAVVLPTELRNPGFLLLVMGIVLAFRRRSS